MLKINKLNKKAISLAITILVILVLVLVGFTLFSMITGAKNLQKKVIAPAYIFESISSEEEQLAFYLTEILEKAFVKTYYDFAKNFNSETEISKQEFETKLIENIKIINNNLKTGESIELGAIKKEIEKENFKINIDDASNIEFFIPDYLDLGIYESGITVRHKSDLKAKLSFNNLQFHSFQEIFDKIKICKEKANEKEMNEGDMKACFNLKYFDVEVAKAVSEQENKEFFDVILTSKKKFLIDNMFEDIDMEFIIEKEITS